MQKNGTIHEKADGLVCLAEIGLRTGSKMPEKLMSKFTITL